MNLSSLLSVLVAVFLSGMAILGSPDTAIAVATDYSGLSLTGSFANAPSVGSLSLPTNKDKGLPGFINTSKKPVTIKLQALNKLALLSPDAKVDQSVLKYKTEVDADGYGSAVEGTTLKYPEFKLGVLVGEIKDAQGKTKSLISGKEQTFELQPSESVTFIVNDDVKSYADNIGTLKLDYSVVAPCGSSVVPDNDKSNTDNNQGSEITPPTPCSIAAANATPEFLLNLPYKGFADSPFNTLKASADWFEFDSFDGPGFALKASGVKASSPNETAKYTDPGFFDSVDEDDKVLDGKGRGQDRLVLSNGDITFTFDSTRGFPTDAGIVWTDFHGSDPSFGQGKLTFEAFDATGKSLGVQGPFVIGGDYSTMGETGEDRFFGVHYNGGISKFRIIVPGVTNGVEFDHLQFGRKCRI